MRKRFDIPVIQSVANDLLRQCEQLQTAVDDGDSVALLDERIDACRQTSNRLHRLLAADFPAAFDFSDIVDAGLPANQRVALISLRERLDRIFHPTNFRGPQGEIVDPLTAKSVAFNQPIFREWAAILRPAVAELNAVSIESSTDVLADSVVKLSPAKARALQAYDSARKANPDATMQELYDWLRAEGDDSHTLPAFATWARYVREGRRTSKRMEADAR